MARIFPVNASQYLEKGNRREANQNLIKIRRETEQGKEFVYILVADNKGGLNRN